MTVPDAALPLGMSEARWLFLFTGDAQVLRRDVEAWSAPDGLTLTVGEPDLWGRFGVYARDTALAGKSVMPYPNQLAFLDYLAETEGYKTDQYQFMRIWGVPDWCAEYLESRR